MAFFFFYLRRHEQGSHRILLPKLWHTIAQMGWQMPQLRGVEYLCRRSRSKTRIEHYRSTFSAEAQQAATDCRFAVVATAALPHHRPRVESCAGRRTGARKPHSLWRRAGHWKKHAHVATGVETTESFRTLCKW